MAASNIPDKCCASVPRVIPEGYQRKGTVKTSSKGWKYYETAIDVKRNDIAVVVIYDALGPNNPQTDQQADRISSGLGVKVVMPDYFGLDSGYPGDIDNIDYDHFSEWIRQHGSPEVVIEKSKDIIQILNSEGITKINVVGFCYGGLNAKNLATSENPLFATAGSIHGRKYTADDASKINIPFFNLASQKEGPQDDFVPNIKEGIKERSVFLLYGDVPHGFAAARGRWATDELHKERADQAIRDYVDFVKKALDLQ